MLDGYALPPRDGIEAGATENPRPIFRSNSVLMRKQVAPIPRAISLRGESLEVK